MTIQRKPKVDTKETAAQAFIDGDNSQIPKPSNAPKARAVKKPVALRFDGDLLARIDAAAVSKGISRNAWISYMCAEALENE